MVPRRKPDLRDDNVDEIGGGRCGGTKFAEDRDNEIVG